MSDYYITVARTQVLKSEARCICCKEPFTKANVFTTAGMKEVAISGMCEKCFDGYLMRTKTVEYP
jgi:hypothetical protein